MPCASATTCAAAVSLSVATKAGSAADTTFALLIRPCFSHGHAAWKKLPGVEK